MTLRACFPLTYQGQETNAQLWEEIDNTFVVYACQQQIGKMEIAVNHDRVKISALKNFTHLTDQKVKGIGTLLVQCAIIRAIEERISKVTLMSVSPALFFYWKLGFRPNRADICLKMRCQFVQHRGNTEALKLVSKTFSSSPMKLPKSSLNDWKAVILRDDNPLLTKRAFIVILEKKLAWANDSIKDLIFSYFTCTAKGLNTFQGELSARK